MLQLEALSVALEAHVATIHFNRPDKANALNEQMWDELRRVFEWADDTPEVRVVVLAGEGRHFCAGIDLMMLAGLCACGRRTSPAPAPKTPEPVTVITPAQPAPSEAVPVSTPDGTTPLTAAELVTVGALSFTGVTVTAMAWVSRSMPSSTWTITS